MPQSGCFIIQLPRRVLRVYWLGYLPGTVFRERVSRASSLVCTDLKDVQSSSQRTVYSPFSGSDQIEKAKHRFSEPWEDSDLILVVEDEKFHVHRLILSMNSPVFKTMFKSQFKEATSSEILLPEKKANEMLDFLKHIYFGYFKHHIEEPVEINSKAFSM